jgi:hypothetical protein
VSGTIGGGPAGNQAVWKRSNSRMAGNWRPDTLNQAGPIASPPPGSSYPRSHACRFAWLLIISPVGRPPANGSGFWRLVRAIAVVILASLAMPVSSISSL